MRRAAAIVIALAGLAAGCGPRPEQPVLAEFFNASRLRDLTALRKIATTVFDPARDGIITDFTIKGVDAHEAGGRSMEDVAISAPVKPMAGPTVEKQLVVTLEKDLTGSRSGVKGRWIVTSVREAGAAP
jgi:hypothetical protein